MEHEFVALTNVKVKVYIQPGVSDPLIVPLGESKTVVGCQACNMGLAEALELPNCMGRSLEDMLNGEEEEAPKVELYDQDREEGLES